MSKIGYFEYLKISFFILLSDFGGKAISPILSNLIWVLITLL